MDLAEHEALHGARVSAPKVTTTEVWRQARALHPAGTKLMRVIDLHQGLQIFQPIPETELNFLDGATVVRPSLPDDHTLKEWADMIAAYDAHFMGITA